ncbi:MAG: MFS transporter [Phycisphaerales bacterium]
MLAVVVAALGYFVDLYDLVIYSVVRVRSLGAPDGLGLPPAEPGRGATFLEQLQALLGILTGQQPGDVTSAGLVILNAQLVGMVLGGIAWGVLGDRRGRLTVLFGSILLYSVANLGNAFVQTVPQYAFLRFVAGFGLAGELGAGITLVSELMSRSGRGWGTTIVAGVGLLGPIAASIVGQAVHWRTAYIIGGIMGLSLLVIRIGVVESGLFEATRTTSVRRGSLTMLLWPPSRLRRYLCVVFTGVPIWFVGGIVFVFAPELGRALGLPAGEHGRPSVVDPAVVILCGYAGAATGDIVSGVISQLLRSRKWTIGAFLTLLGISGAVFFKAGGNSLVGFYALVYVMGLATGYWAIFVTVASEVFGTNLRATATTTAPNFVRGFAVVITTAWELLKGPVGSVPAAALVGAVTLALGFAALAGLPEPFGRCLDFQEE